MHVTGYYERQAQYYDAIYAAQGKDYQREAQILRDIIARRGLAAGGDLLDVACGTGGHLRYLQDWFHVEGLDLDDHMLNVARRRFPAITFHQGDMTGFNLGRQYDAITCLFSAIGYVKTVDQLNVAMAGMARHLKPGGVLIVEPWFAPDEWRTNERVFATFVDEPALKLARMSISERRDDIAVINFHFLVGTPQGVEHFTELHELHLFTGEQYLQAFAQAGFKTTHDEIGITDRGLYIGVRTV